MGIGTLIVIFFVVVSTSDASNNQMWENLIQTALNNDSKCGDYTHYRIKEFGVFKNGVIKPCEETTQPNGGGTKDYNVVFKGDKFNPKNKSTVSNYFMSFVDELKKAYDINISLKKSCDVQFNMIYTCEVLLKNENPRMKLYWKATDGSDEYTLNLFMISEAKKNSLKMEERNKPFKMEFTYIHKFKQYTPIDPSLPEMFRKSYIKRNNRAKALTSKTDYSVEYKDGSLNVKSSTLFVGEKDSSDWESDIKINDRSYILLSSSLKGETYSVQKQLTNRYSLTIYNHNNWRTIDFNSMDQLTLLLDKLKSANSSMNVYHEEEFTKKVFIKKNHSLCNSPSIVEQIQVLAGDKFHKLFKDGGCVVNNKNYEYDKTGKNGYIKEGYLNEKTHNSTLDVYMIKISASQRHDERFYWIHAKSLQ